MTTPKKTAVEVANAIKVDRKLPPHELNARRRRKRNLTHLPNVELAGQPIRSRLSHVNPQPPIPQSAQPVPKPETDALATHLPVSDFS